MIVDDLKKSLLMQAFQGNLSVTDTADTNVEISYKRIAHQKEELIKNNKVGNEPTYMDLSEEEKIFSIPLTWKWYRIGELGVFKKGPFGSSLTKSMFIKDCEDAIKVYEQKNAIQKNINLGEYYISKKYFEEKMKSFEVNSGDIIVSCAGTIGETYVIPKIFRKGIINQALMKITMVKEINISYFLLYFDFILKKQSNNLSSGSAIKNIPSFDIFKQLPIPLPPIEEQQRIVNKIEELFAKLDEIKPIEEELIQIKADFPKKMKNTILKEAFDGKYSLNSNWQNDKLGNVCIEICTGNSISESTKKNKYTNIESGYNYIGTKDLNFNHIFNYENGVKIPFEEPNFKYANIGDILLCIEGGSAGKKIGILTEKVCYGNKLCKFSSTKLNPKFLYYYLQSPQFTRNFYDNLAGIIGGVSINKIRTIEISFPSLEEQQKIVNKIEQLLQLCDDIEQLIKES